MTVGFFEHSENFSAADDVLHEYALAGQSAVMGLLLGGERDGLASAFVRRAAVRVPFGQTWVAAVGEQCGAGVADAVGCVGRAGNRALCLGRRPLLGSCPWLCRWPPGFSVCGASSYPNSRRAVFFRPFNGTFCHVHCDDLPWRLRPSYFST